MSEPTPGPWIAIQGTEDEAERWQVCQDGPRKFIIAEIHNGAPGDTLQTEEANARLIACAPDLLAACKAIEFATEGLAEPANPVHKALWSLMQTARDLARAAIAKAEGKA